jgi:hypothetical protein
MISLRLHQLASQQGSDGTGPTRGLTPTSNAIAVIPELQQIWKAQTYERLEQALDQAQVAIIKALESEDPNLRLAAAKLMMRTKQARERGLAA